ncbi:MAG: type II secretion system protein [Pseudomonadota bacterium]
MRHIRSTGRPQHRGFTLIELMVSLAVVLIVSAAGMELYVIARKNQSEGMVQASISRDAQLVLDWVERDLSYLGAGVPRGCPATSDTDIAGSCATKSLRPPIRIGHNDNLVFVGDLPLPHSDLNGIVQIAAINSGSLSNAKLTVMSELSGCVPPSAGTDSGNHHCATHLASLIPTGSATDCNSSNPTAATCPWGLNKWFTAAGNTAEFIIGYPNGTWTRKRWNGTNGSGLATTDDYYGVVAEANWPAASLQNVPQSELFTGKASTSFISHIDRVFYSVENTAGAACGGSNCVLKRRQCWAKVQDPSVANWPPVQNTRMRSSSTPADCSPPDEGTPWMTLMTGIRSMEFKYYQNSDSVGTDEINTSTWDAEDSSRTRLVEVILTLERKIPRTNNRFIKHTVRRRVLLRNRGGIADPSIALSSGGCLANGTVNECQWD